MSVKELFEKDRYDMSDLREVFGHLRGENGCPWDRVQTHESIRANLIEETYEVVEAIDTADLSLLREELGDLLLQVVFHAGIEEEQGTFTFDDVVSDVTDKLLRRHPHVFGDVKANDEDGALNAWESAKLVEKTERKTTVDSMNAVPPSLPALMRAQKIVKKAMKDSYSPAALIADGARSLRTLADLMESPEAAVSPELIGEALLAISAFSQVKEIDGELELTRKSEKFIASFE
ncbi:MAG: MazG family protein [Clostridia bacterium]|nr:MazG family protein [Clostridia bacterium]